MSKTKSVVMTTLLTIVIVLLSLMCVVPEFALPFRVNGIWNNYNSVISVISYGSDLGGGYSATYYPEGVISVTTYNTDAEYYTENLENELKEYLDKDGSLSELRAEYQAGASNDVDKAIYDYDNFMKKYAAYTSDNFDGLEDVKEPALYMEINEACYETETAGKYALKDDFKEEFETAVTVMAKRFDKKNFSSLSVSVKDGCTIEVKVPSTVEDVDSLFSQIGYTGKLTLRANEDITSKPLLNPMGASKIADYFKSASSYTVSGTGVVQIDMTSLGRETVYNLTNELKDNETDATLYFYIGENEVIGLGLRESIDQNSLHVSGSFTKETAENVAIVIDSCINEGVIDMSFTLSESVEYTVGAGANIQLIVGIIFAVAILAMIVFFIVRYKGMGAAHAYAYLSYLICMIMFVAFLGGMSLSVSGVFAIAVTSILMVITNVYVLENIRKEFNTGKTLTSAIKSGYKNSLAAVLDSHLVLFIIAFVLFFASVGEIVTFSYIFLLGVLMSGISTLILSRYYAYVMRGLLERSKQPAFYGFKREVIEDDED